MVTARSQNRFNILVNVLQAAALFRRHPRLMNDANYCKSENQHESSRFAAAQHLLISIQELNPAGIAEAINQMQKTRAQPLELPATVVGNPSLRAVSNQILRHGSLSVNAVPFSIKLGWQVDF
jgi:hypothetical protein